MRERRLSPKQRTFVREYLIDLNATRAAVRAGYSPATAQEQSSRLLSKAMVRRAVREAMRARAARTQTTADEVVREFRLIAFSSIRNYEVDEDGKLRVRRGADLGAARAVQSFKRTVRTRTSGGGDRQATEVAVETEIRLWDKVRALVALGQHLGMFKAAGPDPIHDLLAKLPADVALHLRALLGLAGAGRPPALPQ
jgi:phage terminase small subunit